MVKKNSLITFRIDDGYARVLRQVAQEKKITLNALANQIFGEYVELQRFTERFGTIIISKDGFETLLNALDERQIMDVAYKIGSKAPKEFILFKWKDLTDENFGKFVSMYFEHCGYGKSDIEINGGTNTISVRHDLGKKGSLFFKLFMEAAVQSIFDKSCESVVTDNLLTVRFKS